MWLPYVQLSVTDKENPSATTSIPFTEGGEYEIAIGATYKTALRVPTVLCVLPAEKMLLSTKLF